ncbi:MAG: response regulator [Candidatus Omnitrophota bacterium]
MPPHTALSHHPYIPGHFRSRATLPSILLILSLAFFFINLLTPMLQGDETGFKFFRNYNYKEYEHQPQNWGMAQARNGILYVANHGGILEFDGVSWRVIYVPNKIVRSLSIDETGTVYVGGKNEIGYLAPDTKGSLHYVSLTDQITEPDAKNFADVWSTHAASTGIYFCASKFLFCCDPHSKKIKTFKTATQFKSSFIVNGSLVVQEKDKGLLRLTHGSWVPVPGGETFSTDRIYLFAPYNQNKKTGTSTFLIGTCEIGFFLYDGKTMTRFPNEVDPYLKEKLFSHGIGLSNGDFALATLQGGVVIMDSQGKLKSVFDKKYGIQDDNVKFVFEDDRANLWLCLNQGLSKIEYNSPLSLHDERADLPGLAISVIRHHQELFAGTSNGLYVLESPQHFRPVPGINASCWGLLSVHDSLLAATDSGVFEIKNKKAECFLQKRAYVLVPSRRFPGTVWCGTVNGLTALSLKNNRWVEGPELTTIAHEVRSIAEDERGTLWLGASTGGVSKLRFPSGIDHPETIYYDEASGIPKDRVFVSEAAGHTVFATEKGIYRFDEPTHRFVPDDTLGPEFSGGSSQPVFFLVQDADNQIWFNSESRNFCAIPDKNNKQLFTISAAPFRRIPLIQVNAIYPDPDGNAVWFASYDGLIRYDRTIKKNYAQRFETLIRRITVNDQLIFDGFKYHVKSSPSQTAAASYPTFEYKNRNFHFEFTAPSGESETHPQYRSIMEGYDKQWSNPTIDSKRNYTNLDEGTYTFRVQAQNIYGYWGNEDVYRFVVLPPVYKTWWAYLIYVSGFVVFVFFIVKWRAGKLQTEKHKLEEIVKERTQEIQDKSSRLEEQTLQLKSQSEKLKEMDQIKSRFFANISHEFRTPLTLIMSPLEEILSETRDKKQRETFHVMLRNSRQLLVLINQLLDLARFDSGRMKLRAGFRDIIPFLKGIVSAFSNIAVKNRLELTFRSEIEGVTLYFDSQRLEEVMNNLLINAVKFTPPEGTITVYVFETDGFIHVSIKDTGPGISRERLPHIFDRFSHPETTGGIQKGTGIGLSLTKEIILLHHGKIDVHSEEGKGTEFVIQLPMGSEHLQPDEIVPSEWTAPPSGESRTLDPGDTADSQGGESLSDSSEPDQEKTEQSGTVVLVVEDHADVRRYIRSALEPDYVVMEAGEGREGIEKAKEVIPDLIISDIMMPDVDGYQLCHELKKDIKTSHIPIILLTAKASEESIIQGLETGADDYVTKPFNTKVLLTRIKNLIDLRRQLQLKIQRQKTLLPSEIPVSSLDETFLKEFQELIDKNLSDPDFDVDHLCRKLIMGRSTLFRKVKALTGETPNQFILSYRLERGAQLLKKNFGNVTEVAMEVGFSSPTYFATCFKEKFHQSPSTFQASESKTKS